MAGVSGSSRPTGEWNRPTVTRPEESLGWTVDKHGDTVTDLHVVKGADAVTVRLFSNRKYRGRIVDTGARGTWRWCGARDALGTHWRQR
jgi:S1-C subfamily serine protease